MAKRFTDGEIWKKPWFRNLTQAEKNAWFYIKDNCDAVGVWTPDYGLAEFQIGASLDWDAFPSKTNGNIEVLECGKWMLTDFVEFQYGALSKASKPHQYYIKLIERHGLADRYDIYDNSPSHKAMRQRITQRKRDEIFLFNEFMCQYCGKQFTSQELTIDHMIPLSSGGTNDDDNLVASCLSCNARKSNQDPRTWIQNHVPQNLLKGLLERLDSLYKKLQALKEKEKEQDKEKEKYSPAFGKFWQSYPRKAAKHKAAEIWKRDKLDSMVDEIIAKVQAYSQTDQWLKDGGKFIPHPTTFLNQRRYEDDVTPSTQSRFKELK